MNSLVSIAYVSTAVRRLDEAELEVLLHRARTFNAIQRVTGVLLYHDGNFFQYLEGTAEDIGLAYARIKASKLHHGMVELLHEMTDRLQFEQWSMGFSAAPESIMLALEHATWSRLSRQLDLAEQPSSGLALLLQFWRNSQRA